MREGEGEGERERERERENERRGREKHPSLAGEMGFISMCSYSVMVEFFFYSE